MSFDFNVSYSSCWGYSLINTLRLKSSTFFALGTVPVPHTACTTTDVAKNRRQQRPLCARVLPCLRAPCPYLRVPFLRAGLTLACLCLAYAACVLFARVCHVITSGDPLTNPLRVSYSAHCTCYVHHARCFRWLLLLYVRKYSHT